ncbi:GNAT family N-acetyltransferase [Serratia silvae]|uniref:GNAT family N-acetyltransferase n=1 Tax=Serratia silvae TaxID=2824122 RepID=A0ABT0K969_9GAMM|nr:GNAT family N-acetyltransferase [Serratia silvae]MCL1028563.1 GNAT family N-acetyltransferase [Serratia silvae]
MPLVYKKFSSVNLSDPFFDTLKQDYPEFELWFESKKEALAYVSTNEDGNIDGFLYLKVEDEALDNMTPSFSQQRRVKLGTFKIDAHGTKLGERFLRLVFDFASKERVKLIYVTIFDKHKGLISLLERYGFEKKAYKNLDTANGQEGVYFKPFVWRN